MSGTVQPAPQDLETRIPLSCRGLEYESMGFGVSYAIITLRNPEGSHLHYVDLELHKSQIISNETRAVGCGKDPEILGRALSLRHFLLQSLESCHFENFSLNPKPYPNLKPEA